MARFTSLELLLVLLCTVSLVFGKRCSPQFSCSDTETCCSMGEGKGFGCCPFRNAVCCSDHQHCCPHGMKCNVKESRCFFDKNHLPWNFLLDLEEPQVMEKLSPAPIKLQEPVSTGQKLGKLPGNSTFSLNELIKSVDDKKLCPDSSYSCDKMQTCCQLREGWGCCPLGPNAVCCRDQEHCCPSGTTCNPEGQSCIVKP